MHKIVALCGTSRPNNMTEKALRVVCQSLMDKGFEVDLFLAEDMNLNFPGQAPSEDSQRMTEAVKDSIAVVIATPEYHGTFAAMTKLMIENMGFPSALSGKPVAMLGVAAGRIGAIKSLEQLKGVVSHVGAIAVPGAVSIAGVNQAFDESGKCTDVGSENALQGLAGQIENFVKDYVCPKLSLESQVREKCDAWSTSV